MLYTDQQISRSNDWQNAPVSTGVSNFNLVFKNYSNQLIMVYYLDYYSGL